MEAALKLYQSGRYEEAVDLYTSCLDQSPSHDHTARIATLFNRSLCHTKLKRYDQALNDYSQILQLDCKNVRTNAKNIKTLCQLGRFNDAYGAAVRWKSVDPDCQQANNEVERLGVIVNALSLDQDDSDDDDAVTLIPDEPTPPGHRSLSSPVDDASGTSNDRLESGASATSPVRDGTTTQHHPVNTFEGVTLPNDGSGDRYQCTYCDISFSTQSELKTHCRSDLHKERIVCDEKKGWLFRDPPRGLTSEEYTKCPRVDDDSGCRLGSKCPQAHSDDELNEWKERFEYKKQLLQKARDNELHGGTCAERLLEKWISSDEPGNVMTETIPGVKIYVNSDQKMNVSTRRYNHAWLFTVTTRLHLYRVFLLDESNHSYFQISSITIGPKRNQKPQKLDEICQEWNNPASPVKNSKNETVYRVKILFRTDIFGTFRQVVVFDFGHEPYLRQDLCVESSTTMDFDKLQEELNSMEVGKWDANSKNVVQFEPAPFVPTPADLDLMKQYPMPTAAQVAKFSCLEAANTTASNYRERMHSLLAIEEMAQFSNISKYNLNTTLRMTDKYMLTPSPNSTAKYSSGGELFAQMTLTKDVSEDTAYGRLILSNVSVVLVAPHDKDKEPDKVYEALVEDKGKNFIFLKLSAKCVKDLNLKPDSDFNAQIQFQLNRVPLCEMHASVDRLSDPGLLFPDTAPRAKGQTTKVEIETRFGRGVNEKQCEAIQAIISDQDPSAPVVLVGPYGTGKTFTLAQAAFEIMKNDPEARVLICCHSNSSADLYIRDYFHAHPSGDDGWRPLRIVYKHRWMSTFDDIVLEFCLREKHGHMTMFKYPDMSDLEKHRVVVTTCNMTRCLHDLNLPHGFFTHILIDEAAQALESELLMPLSFMDANTRIVLAGDYMQMSPEVHSDYARQCDFHVSLLERLVDLYANDHPCKIMLCENYRSDQVIINFTSDLFYERRLLAKAVQMPHEKFYALSFFTARGEDVQHRNSTGFHNDAEVYEVAERVSEIQKSWPKQWGEFDGKSIGVVSPYADQVVRIRAELRKRKLGSVSVERVFNVQGKQFRVIILSTVRTRHTCTQAGQDDMDYGFLSNIKVLNTAFTRAQSLVGVVGDPVSLCTVGKCRKIWEEFISICHKHESLYGITWNQLRAHLDGLELKKTYVLNPLAPEFIPNRLRHGAPVGYNNQYYNMIPQQFNMPMRPAPGMFYLQPGLPPVLPQVPYNMAANMAFPWGYGYGMPWMPRYVMGNMGNMGNTYMPYGPCPPQQPAPQISQPVQKPNSPGRHRSLSGDSVFSQTPLQQHLQPQAIEKQRRPSVDGRYTQHVTDTRQRTTVSSNVQPWQETSLTRPRRPAPQPDHQDTAIAGSPNLQREFYHYLVRKEGKDEAMRVMDHIVNDADFAQTFEGRPLFKRNPIARSDAASKQGLPLVHPGPGNANGLVQKERNEHMVEFERRRHGSSSSIETRSQSHWSVDSSVWPRNLQKQQQQLQQQQLQQQQQQLQQHQLQQQTQRQQQQQQQQNLRNPLFADFSKPPPKLPNLPSQLQSAFQSVPQAQKSKTMPQRTQQAPNPRYVEDQNREWRYPNLMGDQKALGEDSLVRFLTQSVESANDSDSDLSGAITASSSQSSVFFSNEVEERILPVDPEPQPEYNLFGTTPDRRRHMSAPHRFHSSGETPPAYMDNLHDKKAVESPWDRRSMGRNSLSQLMQKSSSPQPIPSPHLDLELNSSFGENSFQNRPVADTPDKDVSDPLDLLRNLNIRSSPGTEAFYYFS